MQVFTGTGRILAEFSNGVVAKCDTILVGNNNSIEVLDNNDFITDISLADDVVIKNIVDIVEFPNWY